MSATRRDLITMTGGAALGLVFTPVPWKLLDDVSIWTQNWPWTPSPPRGEITTAYSVCTLCPAGCGVKVRRVNGVPFGMAAAPGGPGGGVLCPLGFGAHQMPFHPARLRAALHRGQAVPLEEALGAVSQHLAAARRSGACVAVLDQRPGRMMSLLYRRFLTGFPGALYLTPPLPEQGTLRAVAALAGKPAQTLAYDFERARTIFSVGTPLLDGWGVPGRLLRLWSAPDREVRFLHADSRCTRTASLADRWLAIRPGSENALALGLAAILVREHGAGKGLRLPPSLASFSLEEASAQTGIPAGQLLETAGELASRKPSLVAGGGDPVAGPLPAETERALALLNVLLGAVGAPGGVIERPAGPGPSTRDLPPETLLTAAPSHSVQILIADAASSGCALPEALLRDKLAKDAVTIRLSAFRTARAAGAEWALPVPAPFETLEDVPEVPGAAAASWALSVPQYTPPAEAIAPEAVLHRLGLPEEETLDRLFHEKAEAIQRAGRGEVVSPADAAESAPPAGDLWDKLNAGAIWVDAAPAAPRPVSTSVPEIVCSPMPVATSPFPLVATPAGSRGGAGHAPPPPLASKLTRESHLEPAGGEVRVHPATAKAAGLAHRRRAVLETPAGAISVSVRCDRGVARGLVEVAVEGDSAPESLALFPLTPDGCWRVSPARLRRA